MKVKQQIINLLDKLPYIRGLKKQIEIYKTAWPPGHYYSPEPPRKEILQKEKEIFNISKRDIPGVGLNEKEQLALLEEIKKYYSEMPFETNKKNNLRYYFDNGFFCYSDAIFLYSVMRHFKPERIIEVGSGFSSAVMLDVDEYFMNKKVHFTFIEPNAERLLSLIKQSDEKKHNIIRSNVQEVGVELFEKLQVNDILFIDSSHIAKIGSDVNFLLFDVLPRLNKGVLIQFHDIYYPFEYPKKRFIDGWSSNECYILRAFLQYNQEFKIILFNTFLEHYHKDWFSKNMPLCLKNTGACIWLKKEN